MFFQWWYVESVAKLSGLQQTDFQILVPIFLCLLLLFSLLCLFFILLFVSSFIFLLSYFLFMRHPYVMTRELCTYWQTLLLELQWHHKCSTRICYSEFHVPIRLTTLIDIQISSPPSTFGHHLIGDLVKPQVRLNVIKEWLNPNNIYMYTYIKVCEYIWARMCVYI